MAEELCKYTKLAFKNISPVKGRWGNAQKYFYAMRSRCVLTDALRRPKWTLTYGRMMALTLWQFHGPHLCLFDFIVYYRPLCASPTSHQSYVEILRKNCYLMGTNITRSFPTIPASRKWRMLT